MGEYLVHPLAPVYTESSGVLILGTFPSPQSRRNGFYYGHPQNRFWRVLAAVFSCDVPCGNEEKLAFLKEHRIALWDVLSSCEITGASDSSIRNPVPNDLKPLLGKTRIKAVFLTGKRAAALYDRFQGKSCALPHFCLPSPSPANCAVHMEQLVAAYRAILPYLSD